ncbi:M1 family metallopeptidase [uncultured Hymenobacter sp.]|uniref:M1 family metallopeptidase n=1 Tax=uncultured Hymenobacter sp. TaxID=170016 RepID=UPI0035CBAD78
MRNTFLLSLGLLLAAPAPAQTAGGVAPTPPETPYRAAATKINDLVHTKLDVSFDYAKRYLNGAARLTLRPHGYATDSLRLDAKGMDIKSVALVEGGRETPLKYDYSDKLNLRVNLGRRFKAGEEYTVAIAYTAKPDELKAKGSAAISDAKGLYFINPDSTEPSKPRQIWTQGETEASSAWFPTIDRPNQKTTSEISMTVPSKYVTLSNGALVSQKPAGPGLRTDTWKMDLPHAPYLFMMAVGDFKIYKDTWRGKEVSYYLEPKYAPYAKQIFGNTPDMLEFFSTRLGVEYPWNKYSQIVARDYVSGAMENTTATLHGEFVQMTDRELLDRPYTNESVIAHELFHQWFGDYVTAESWSNITVNESFADFSEGLYAEHKYGRDAGDLHQSYNLRRYLASPSDAAKQLVRFHYEDKEEVFDLVSYQKGGAILNMLRTYLGDDVFFGGLQKYLTDNKFGNGEAQQLRLALEAVSGQDLNWFFNQWYYGTGHPVVTIAYAYDAGQKVQRVTLKQTQPGQVFQLPLAIDLYVNGKVQRQQVMMREASETFSFPVAAKPDLVNMDANKTMVWQKTDNKSIGEYAFQYKNAPLYVDRREALVAAGAQPDDKAARALSVSGLNDKFYGLRQGALQYMKLDNAAVKKAALPAIRKLATADKSYAVQAEALRTLGQAKDKQDEKLFRRQLSSQSYAVQGAALAGLATVSPAAALAEAKKLESSDNDNIVQAVSDVYATAGGLAEWPRVRDKFQAASPQNKFGMLQSMVAMMSRIDDVPAFTEGVGLMRDLNVKYKAQIGLKMMPAFEGLKQAKAGTANAATFQQVVDQAVAQVEAAK